MLFVFWGLIAILLLLLLVMYQKSGNPDYNYPVEQLLFFILLYFPMMFTLWLWLRLSLLAQQFSDKGRREQMALTLIPADLLLLEHLKKPLFYALAMIVTWGALFIGLLLLPLFLNQQYRFGYYSFLTYFFDFSGNSSWSQYNENAHLLLFIFAETLGTLATCCAITLLGVIVGFRRLCSSQSSNAYLVMGGYAFGALALTYGVRFALQRNVFITGYDLRFVYISFSLTYLLGMFALSVSVAVKQWRKASVEFCQFK